jgi:hypothetical protein
VEGVVFAVSAVCRTSLGESPATLDALTARLKMPRRTARIVVDAVTALGLLERHGDQYRNNKLAHAYLSGRGPVDMRPFIRFRNRLRGLGGAGEVCIYGDVLRLGHPRVWLCEQLRVQCRMRVGAGLP